MSRWLIALAACGVALPAFAQLSPEQTIKSMTVADGLQVELFAAEPMLINPTSIDVDHRGRVWVCEAVNYRRKAFGRPILREEGDRIVILEDTTSSGKADKSTVFYQGKDLIAPIGICVAAYPNPEKKGAFSYKVFVCQSPDILLFEDKDGDGKADGPPKKFLTGFRGFDHDHGVHGINIGPDGKLYFTVGDQGVDGLQSSDGKGRKWKSNDTDCRAGTVWRCDMDGTNLELIAHNFRNNYECCVNSFGEIWLSDNDDDGNQQTRICYVMPGGNYGYYPRGKGESHWHEEQPGIVHKALRTGFGSPTGICFYEGTLLPEKYRGQLLHTDAGPREFRAFHIKPKGAGYELEKENLVTSTDTWFRLSDVCVAPDGSVMLADWYDPGVGGHGMGDWTRGRIYRVTPKGHKGYKIDPVRADRRPDIWAGLEGIGSPCQATRWIGYSQLSNWIDRSDNINPADQFNKLLGTTQSKEDIDKYSRDPTRYLYARAIWAFRKIPWTKFTNAKENAVFGSRWFFGVDVPGVAGWMRCSAASGYLEPHLKMLADASLDGKPTGRELLTLSPPDWGGINNWPVAYRRELLLALQKLRTNESIAAFYKLAKTYDGQDHFYRAALNIACGTDPKRREAILAEFDKHFPDWNDKVADLVWELRPASTLARLPKLLEDSKLTAAQKGRIVDILAVYDTADAGKTMLTLLNRDVPAEIKSRAVENLRLYLPTKWKELQKTEELYKAVADLLKKRETINLGLQIGLAAPDCGIASDAEQIAGDKAAARETRILAVQVIGKIRHVKYFHVLEDLIRDPVIGPAAVEAIGEFATGTGVNSGGKEALELLGKIMVGPNMNRELEQAALRGLVGTRQGSALILRLKEENKLSPTLVADAGRMLRNSPFADLRNRANLAFPAPGKLDLKKLPAPAVLAKRTGNATRGEALFIASAKNDTQCLRCHAIRGVGGNIGPDLSMIGKKASKENLFESILLPSKAIADQYLQWKINTLDGKSVTGLLVAENDKEITIRDANGKDYTFAQKDLDGPKQKSLVSIMPDNLAAAFTLDELTDVVEYLLTLKTPTLTPDSWYVMGPFIRVRDNPLGRDFGPEKAKFDPKATFPEWNTPSSGPPPKDLSWRTIHADAKGYIDLAALHGDSGVNSVSYLYRAIESLVEQTAEFLIGSDDGCVLFVNGKEVLRENVTRAAAPNQNRVKVTLKAGKNEVLMKIANGNNPHGAYVTIVSEQELKMGK